jgi:hypothetical protein
MKRLPFFRLVIMCNILFFSLFLYACSNLLDEESEPSNTIPVSIPTDPTIVPTEPTTFLTTPVQNLIPIISIETVSATPVLSDEIYTDCSITLNTMETEHAFQNVLAGIRLRGNSTQQFDKKPYRIKFDTDIQLLGLGDGPSKSWLLLAEYVDLSLYRNKITYDLANKLMRKTFVTDSAYVELMLNGVSQGVYLVLEQTHINTYRINIDESGVLDGNITNTGYLIELEGDGGRRDSEGTYMTDWFDIPGYSGNPAELGWWNYPEYTTSELLSFYVIKSDAKSPAQVSYIQDYMMDVYDAIYVDQSQQTIENLIDIESAVDMFLLQLITNDFDNNFSSRFLYKDKDGKIIFGPPWDFDLSYGNHYSDYASDTIHMNHLLYKLSSIPWFMNLVKERWSLISGSSGMIDEMIESIDIYQETYGELFESNHEMWAQTRQTTGWHVIYHQTNINSHEDAVNYLKSWLNARITFINTYLA